MRGATCPRVYSSRAQQTLAPLGKRLEGLGAWRVSAPTQRLSASAWRVSAVGSRHRPSASWQALGDPNWSIREARQQLFCSANVGAIYYPRLTTHARQGRCYENHKMASEKNCKCIFHRDLVF